MNNLEKEQYGYEEIVDNFFNVEEKPENKNSVTEFSKIIELFTKKAFIDVLFSSTDKQAGVLRGFYKGYEFTMDKREMYGKPDMPDAFMNRFVGGLYKVLITSYDQENCTFKVSHFNAKNKGKDIVMTYLRKKLSEGENPVVDAVITGYDNKTNRIHLDIYTLGIQGFIVPAEWSHQYVGNMAEIFSKMKGKIIKVSVLDIKGSRLKNVVVDGHKEKVRERMRLVCSRKRTLGDPWALIEEKLSPNDTIIVKCKDKTTNASGFFAEIEGIEDIDAFCYYPDNMTELPIVEGVWYKGYVKRVSREKKMLTVKVFELLKGIK